jgi:formamidopyrimidine-DNA glycosylase
LEVRRLRVIRPTSLKQFRRELIGATITSLLRRGKYLVFNIQPKRSSARKLLGHLGMTGRMFVVGKDAPLPKHVAVIFDLGRDRFVYEDSRYFGRLTLDMSGVSKLGPEPLGRTFTPKDFAFALKRSRQAIKVKLLDQRLVAGVGNIYASEALFRARISPRTAASRLTVSQVRQLWRAIRTVLVDAIRQGSTIPLSFNGSGEGRLFYFGRKPGAPDYYKERLRVYDRQHQPCMRCRTPIRRIIQAARSTFYCPRCQSVAIRLR